MNNVPAIIERGWFLSLPEKPHYRTQVLPAVASSILGSSDGGMGQAIHSLGVRRSIVRVFRQCPCKGKNVRKPSVQSRKKAKVFP